MGELLDIIEIVIKTLALMSFIYLALFFKKNYQRQKEKGFANKFFQGYSLLFLIMSLTQLFMLLDSVFNLFSISILDVFTGDFPGHETTEARETLKILWNLDRPLYVFGFAVLNLVFAGQIYPLEHTVLQWKAKPITRFNIIAAILLFIIYYPPLQISTTAFYLLLISLIATIFAFFLNVGVNLWLAVKSPGAVRKRALYSLFGFMILMVGFIWALKVGWAGLISPALDNYAWDVVFGCSLEIMSVIFYKKAFPEEQLA